MQYSTNHEVRFGDVDRFGHVNHLSLLEFFESSRNPFLREMAEFAGEPCVLDTGGFVVALLEATFHSAVGPDASSVEVRTSVDRVGTSSATLRYELWNESTLSVSATTVLVFVTDGVKVPISGPGRDFFLKYQTA